MNELHIYASRLKILVLLMIGITSTVIGEWLGYTHTIEKSLAQAILTLGLSLIFFYIIKLLERKPKITFATQGVQFHQSANPFVAWNDIQQIQLNGNQITLAIDDNPPDYERLTEIELANLPAREMELAYVMMPVAGLTVSPQKLAVWLQQMQQAKGSERQSLLLTFYYEQ